MNRENVENIVAYYPKLISRIASLTVIVISILVLIGKFADIQIIKTYFPNLLTMKVAMLFLLLLSGIALWFSITDTPKGISIFVAKACAVAIVAAGIFTLSQYIFNFNFGLDLILIKSGTKPGHTAYTTALTFFLIGTSLLFMNSNNGVLSQLLALIAGIISFFNFTCYIYGTTIFKDAPEPMLLNISLSFIVLCSGILFARPTGFITSAITSNYDGGLTARRLLPMAIVIPLVLWWFNLQAKLIGLYDGRFRRALTVTLLIVIFSSLIWLHAKLLNKANMELQSVRELSGKLLAHDLRNPLSAITGSLEILKTYQGKGTDESWAKAIDNALKASKSLMNMIDTVVDVNKIRDNKMTLNLSNIPLDNLLDEKISMYKQTAQNYGLELRGEFKANNVMAKVDSNLFGRVIDNLLTNALRHTRSGGKVTVGLDKANGHIIIYVEDNGEGIPPQYHKEIFEQYGAAEIRKKMGRHSGTGLGLVFCKLAVEQHKGTIRVESNVGKGSKFIVELPYAGEVAMETPLSPIHSSLSSG